MTWRNNPVLYLSWKLWKYSKGNQQRVVFYFILFLLAGLVELVDPFLVAKIFNTIQEHGLVPSNLPYLIFLFALFLLTGPVFWLFHGPARVIENRNAFLASAHYKKFLLDGTMSLPSAWHVDHHSGDTIDKIGKGTQALYEYGSRTYEVINSVVRLIGSYFILAYFNIHAAYIVVLLMIGTFGLVMAFDRVLIRQYKDLNRMGNETAAKIFDIISNIGTIITLRVEQLASKALRKKILAPFPLYVHNVRVSETKWFLVSQCSTLMTLFVLASYVALQLHLGVEILIGTLYLLYGYLQNISQIFFRFTYLYGDIVQQKTAVLNSEELATSFKVVPSRKNRFRLSARWKTIGIRSLQFSYHSEEGKEAHLQGVSFFFRRGERIAFIGASGGGKTTVLKLLRGLYEPSHVEVFCDSKPVRGKLEAVSRQVTLVPQDPELFATTIRENMTFGAPITEKELQRAMDLACFTEVVGRLPRGLESSIVEKGVNLSGGEKQRLALARGILAATRLPILLLDEPTSSVDVKNERLIYEGVFRTFKDKTIISSVHRLHLLPLFDRMYFFKNGRIIASGTLGELLKSSEEFKRMWKKYHGTQRERPEKKF
ncbi:MAG TPA: ABC transporter ATP-binding protein [Patescibacteria group bacterium]|nr:ABC transporter ATP-binding protein [Patescibacteria group bacterium]